LERIRLPRRLKMRRRKALTFIEILLALTVVAVLFGLIFTFYKSAIEKSKYVEAVATVNSISNAEEMHQTETGEYVAAASTQEVNEKLGLDIKPKWYTYKVIDVTDDDFIVIAERILEDINSGNLSSEPLVIARNKSGPISPDSAKQAEEENASPGEAPPPVPGPSGPGGGGPGGGGPGGGGPGGGGPEDINPPLPGPGGGDDSAVIYPTQIRVPTTLLDLLQDTVFGDWAYDLIHNNSIVVVYVNMNDYGMSPGTNGFWAGIGNQTWTVGRSNVFVTGNTIFLNRDMPSNGYTDNAVASIITHESTHADYTYYPQAWIDATKAAHPELTDSDIHITQPPYNSIDQEYQAFNNDVNVWREIRGTDTNDELDYEITLQDLGEAAFKDAIRVAYAAQHLPEY